MRFPHNLIAGLRIGLFIFATGLVFQAMPARAAGEICVNGNSAPCQEDVQLTGCTLCHSIKLVAGNRNLTDRQIWASSGTNRHEAAPKRADWTSTVQSMIDKGSPAVLELTAGYLNTNYCTGCAGPILGSPFVDTGSITDTAASVSWGTSANGFEDGPTNTVLYYGTNKADTLLGPGCSSCQMVSVAGPVTHHVVNLTGLSSFTQYYLVNEATSSTLGTVRSSYAVSFRTKRPSGECVEGEGAVPARLFVTQLFGSPGSRIDVYNPDTNALVVEFQLPTFFGPQGDPGDLVPSPDGTRAFAMVAGPVTGPAPYPTFVNIYDIDEDGTTTFGTAYSAGTYPLGAPPNRNKVAADPDGTTIYVASNAASAQVETIDSTSGTVLNTFSAGAAVCTTTLGVGVSPDGNTVYLACRGSVDRLLLIDTGTHTVVQTTNLTAGSGDTRINALEVSPDGSKVFLARSSAANVTVFDAAGAVTGTITGTAPRAEAVTPDGLRLYIADSVGTRVVDLSTMTEITTVATGAVSDVAVHPDGSKAYVASLTSYRVIDTATNTISATIGLGSSGGDRHIMVTPGSAGEECPPSVPVPARVYLSNQDSENPSIVALDPETDTVAASIPVNGTPAELVGHPDGSTLYAVVGTSLSVIDVESNVELGSLLGVGDMFNQLAVSPDGSRLYLAYRQLVPSTLKIKVFDTTDPTAPTLMTTVSSGIWNGCYGALGLAVSTDGSQLYMACRIGAAGNADRFYMINTATYTPVQTATYPRENSNYMFINALAVSPDGSRVYVARAHSEGSTVEYFNGTTGARQGAIALPANALPRAAAFTPDGSKLYVTDQVLGTHVINPVTNTRTTTLPQSKSRGLDIAMTADAHAYTTLLFEIHDLNAATNSWVATIGAPEFNAAYQITATPGSP